MPAGTPPTERRIPHRAHLLVLRLGRLPEREVPGILLGVLVAGDPLARPRLELTSVDAGELPIRGKPRDGEIDRAVLAFIGDALLQQPLDQLHHLGNEVRRPRIDGGVLDPEILPVFVKGVDVVLHVLPERDPLLPSGIDRPVVDVGQIHDMKNVVAAGLEPAPEEVLEQEGPKVSDVGVVVDRWAAGVERDPARLERLERLDLAGQRVVESQRHQPAAPALAAVAIASPSAPPLIVTWTRRCWKGLSIDSREKRMTNRRRNSRATFHWEPGWVLSSVLMTTALSVIDSTPSTSMGPSSWRPQVRSVENWAASSRTTESARSTSSVNGTEISTTARDQPRVLLLTTFISPLGTTCMVPSRSRSTTTRRVIFSTTPLFPATSITSPTANWFSSRMKKPEMMSRTRLWAPKEMARPRIPAPARMGAMLMKTLKVSRMAMVTITTRPTLRRSCEMVRPRFSRSVVTESSPSSTDISIRRAVSQTILSPSQASTQMPITRSVLRRTTSPSMRSMAAMRSMMSLNEGSRSTSIQEIELRSFTVTLQPQRRGAGVVASTGKYDPLITSDRRFGSPSLEPHARCSWPAPPRAR